MTTDLKELEKILLELKIQLSKIEAKQDELCRNIHGVLKRHEKLEDQVDNLPCEIHTELFNEKINKRVPWSTFIAVIGFLSGIIFGSYAYTYDIHKDYNNHKVQVQKFIDKEHIDAVDEN